MATPSPIATRTPRRRQPPIPGMAGLAAVLLLGILAASCARPADRSAPPAPSPRARAVLPPYQWQPAGHIDPETSLPAYAMQPGITELYRFALAHPEILSYVPCTCGCGATGHLSNWNCYVRSVSPTGTVTFDDMAPG